LLHAEAGGRTINSYLLQPERRRLRRESGGDCGVIRSLVSAFGRLCRA
jgi:hypothetical protein